MSGHCCSLVSGAFRASGRSPDWIISAARIRANLFSVFSHRLFPSAGESFRPENRSGRERREQNPEKPEYLDGLFQTGLDF